MGHAPLHGKNQSSKITIATSALPPNSIDQSRELRPKSRPSAVIRTPRQGLPGCRHRQSLGRRRFIIRYTGRACVAFRASGAHLVNTHTWN
jgi:hypothetical protein